MKRIALFVLVAYVVLFALLTWPLITASFFSLKDILDSLNLRYQPHGLLEPYKSGWYWLFIGVLLLCQAGLLIIPVRIASRRPTTKRSLYWPVIVSGFLIGSLTLGMIWTLREAFRLIDRPGWVIWAEVGLGVAIWLLWGLVFCRLSSGREPKAVVLQQCKRLLQGSAIAFLVAVPCHILVRQRNECCAGFYTFVGLVFGLAVMLISFGPGVYFLYAARWQKLHPPKF